ncbi:hypothetical protein Tsubulata_033065 [Turnera subulata]|uniref:Uncharacterized protein n=1 Tax=Turnera subulata TaxID=218843 RepID=A0A9Q0G835_9ROSI|nr:hypothetical protein Tsubulata_033065 [Turnera subulata]
MKDDEEVDDNPIEEVRLTVPITDDPTEPVLTFRTWVLGILSCALLAFVNKFFGFRQNQLSIGSVSAQIVTLPIGKLMAATLPSAPIHIPFTNWSFSLNPGPFNMKEHVLITIFASCGASGVYAVHIITSVIAFYHRSIHPVAAMLLVQTTQLLGYGWAGMFRRILVESPYMWWPANLVQVSLFRALHEKEKRPKGGTSRLQFFTIVFISSFAYYIIPGYLFPSLSALSFVCWIWKDSIKAQQLGSGLNGLGMGSFGLDWSTIAGFLGSPLATPFFAIANIMAGFFLFLYIVVPIAYYNNAYGAKKFPFFSSHTFDQDGNTYNISRILNDQFNIDMPAYNNYSKLHLSVMFAFVYGFSFAALMATISHLLPCLPLKVLVKGCNFHGGDSSSPVQLHFSSPCLLGPLANVAFKTYGYISMAQALGFVQDFKLGHYMKIPPRAMFIAQLAGTLVASTVYFGATWWLLKSVEHICNPDLLPEGSPWTCPGDDVFYNASIIWGVIGPLRMFTKLGVYPELNWFFLIGTLAPVPIWLLSRKYPEKKWIPLIHMPIILGATAGMPPARSVHYLSWGIVGVLFQYYIYRRYKGWWARHNYILSAALDAGVAFMGMFLFFTLQSKDVYGPEWWGLDSTDHCPLATCPLAPGVVAKGCPKEEEEEVNDNPIEEVRLTVPITDDPTQPVLTFRTWVLGIASCALLSFVNQFFAYRQNQLFVGSVSAQILVLPIGKLMAASLPTNKVRVPFTNWSFSLNPGPFNMKEHVLITIFANCGASGVYAVYIITIIKVFYKRALHPLAAMLLTQTTQLLGYGWAGMFRKILVDSPYMALHDTEKRPKGGRTRLQFFLLVFVSSFAYYTIPGLFFPSLSALSFVCWIWKDSITAQQIGSGLGGLGIGSFGLDWSTVAGFLGSPLATPFFAIANTMIGFFLFLHVILPIAYWTNVHHAKRFPIFSSHTFDSTGQIYNITQVLNQKTFDINLREYEQYSKLYLSIMFAFIYGLSFASLMATISHVALFEGKTIWHLWRKAANAAKDRFDDVHTRLMKKNYEQVPQWWFIAILVVSFCLAILALEGFGKQLQLPWWGLILACFIALFFTLPVGIIQATTNTFAGTIVASTVYFATAWWLLSSVKGICDPDSLPEGSPWTCPGADVFYNASIIWGVVGPLRMFTSKGIYPEQNWWFLIGVLAPVPVWYLSRKYPNNKLIKNIHIPLILGATSAMPTAKAVHYFSWGAVGVFFNYYIYKRYKGWWARHTYILSAAMDAGVAFMGIVLYFTLQSKDIYGPAWWGLEASDHCPLAKCPTEPGIIGAKGCPTLFLLISQR